jgi:hypothetical protein
MNSRPSAINDPTAEQATGELHETDFSAPFSAPGGGGTLATNHSDRIVAPAFKVNTANVRHAASTD